MIIIIAEMITHDCEKRPESAIRQTIILEEPSGLIYNST